MLGVVISLPVVLIGVAYDICSGVRFLVDVILYIEILYIIRLRL